MKDGSKEVVGSVVNNAFASWADKKWFQVIFIIYALLIPIAGVSYIAYRSCTETQNITRIVSETITQHDKDVKQAHRNAFVTSKQTYAGIKKVMQKGLESIDCEYIFLVEYHNGSENVMTGLQFCKFDITVEVGDDVLDIVKKNKFKDENVAKYDVLLNDDLNSNRLICYTKEQFSKVDSYLAIQLEYLEAKSYAMINLCDQYGTVWGSLLCVSKNEHIDRESVYSCAREIELIVNTMNLQ